MFSLHPRDAEMLVRISQMNQSLVSVVSITLTSEPLQAPNMPTRPIPLICSHDEHAFGYSWGSGKKWSGPEALSICGIILWHFWILKPNWEN